MSEKSKYPILYELSKPRGGSLSVAILILVGQGTSWMPTLVGMTVFCQLVMNMKQRTNV